jgi:hemerythrin-like domain-containing protein
MTPVMLITTRPRSRGQSVYSTLKGMLIRIGGGGAATDEDPIAHLLACHERIRRFANLAARLAHDEGASPAQLAEAAADVKRYFTIALPRHAEDEDVSLRPRLLAHPEVGDDVRRALEVMSDEHGPLDAIILDLAPIWAAVAAEPARVSEHRGVLQAGAAQLQRIVAVHLPPEENLIFPAAAKHLSSEDRASLRAEMRARRAAV